MLLRCQPPNGERHLIEAIVDELLKRRGRVLQSRFIVTGRLDPQSRNLRELDHRRRLLGPRPRAATSLSNISANSRICRSSTATTTPPGLAPALGHEALICNVLRVSLRYRRLGQLDEGIQHSRSRRWNISCRRPSTADDPADLLSCPSVSGHCVPWISSWHGCKRRRPSCNSSSKGQMIARNPQWQMDHRRLLHRIDPRQGDDRSSTAQVYRATRQVFSDDRSGQSVRS